PFCRSRRACTPRRRRAAPRSRVVRRRADGERASRALSKPARRAARGARRSARSGRRKAPARGRRRPGAIPVTVADRDLATLAERLGAALRARAWTLAAAESCTGGWIAKAVTDIAGSSAWFVAGYVVYS